LVELVKEILWGFLEAIASLDGKETHMVFIFELEVQLRCCFRKGYLLMCGFDFGLKMAEGFKEVVPPGFWLLKWIGGDGPHGRVEIGGRCLWKIEVSEKISAQRGFGMVFVKVVVEEPVGYQGIEVEIYYFEFTTKRRCFFYQSGLNVVAPIHF